MSNILYIWNISTTKAAKSLLFLQLSGSKMLIQLLHHVKKWGLRIVTEDAVLINTEMVGSSKQVYLVVLKVLILACHVSYMKTSNTANWC